MNISDFDFILPRSFIAQTPKHTRSDSKLLIIKRDEDLLINENFKNIDKYISSNDLIVVNDTRVIPARLYGKRKNTNGKVEILVERILNEKNILCQVKSTRKLKINDIVIINNNTEIKFIKLLNNLAIFDTLNSSVEKLLSNHGTVPLPPYISRVPEDMDKKLYQTIFAEKDGSVASPTAALHFDQKILKKLKNKKIKICNITLHIGMGTFSPIKTKNIENHSMHSELYYVSQDTVNHIKKCKKNNGKIIAVGTTVARALESFYSSKNKPDVFYETNIFIKPGYNFKIVDHLITNFHLLRSSLLVMICAFYNKGKVLEAYEFAKKHNYKFFSYGDSTMIL